MSLQLKIERVLGFERKKLGKYRDLVLSAVGGLSLMYGWIFLGDRRSSFASSIDWKIGIGCLVTTVLCVLISPNRLRVLAGCFAAIGGLMFLSFFSSGNRTALGVGVTMLILIGIVAVGAGVVEYFRKR